MDMKFEQSLEFKVVKKRNLTNIVISNIKGRLILIKMGKLDKNSPESW